MSKTNTLWVEKYRPDLLENYIGNEHLKNQMAKNIEEKFELVPMPDKSKENPESNEVEEQKSASAAILLQKVEETGHGGIRDPSEAISSQPSASTTIHLPNEGIIDLHFLFQYR